MVRNEKAKIKKGVMKKIRITLVLMLLIILSFSTYGQENEQTVNKIEFKKLPKKVRNQVNSLKGYKVLSTTYIVENNKKVYTVKIDNGKSKHDLKMDENGNLLGREEDYL